jgi:hypothetical protein
MHTGYQQAVELARRRRLALTLRMWRSGEEALTRVCLEELRAGYGRAIELAERDLPDDDTMDSLVRHYCERGGTVDACIATACRTACPAGRLVPGIVRNAAYWRRLRGLLQATSSAD